MKSSSDKVLFRSKTTSKSPISQLGTVMSDTAISLLQNQITQHVICAKCEEEFLNGLTDSSSLQDYTELDVGFTDTGIQVWCRRHDANVVHVDFEGRKLRADFRCF